MRTVRSARAVKPVRAVKVHTKKAKQPKVKHPKKKK